VFAHACHGVRITTPPPRASDAWVGGGGGGVVGELCGVSLWEGIRQPSVGAKLRDLGDDEPPSSGCGPCADLAVRVRDGRLLSWKQCPKISPPVKRKLFAEA